LPSCLHVAIPLPPQGYEPIPLVRRAPGDSQVWPARATYSLHLGCRSGRVAGRGCRGPRPGGRNASHAKTYRMRSPGASAPMPFFS